MTETVEVGAQGIVSEVLFPQVWCEEMDVEGRMRIDALEYVDEIDVRINTLQATRGQQTLDDPDMAPR